MRGHHLKHKKAYSPLITARLTLPLDARFAIFYLVPFFFVVCSLHLHPTADCVSGLWWVDGAEWICGGHTDGLLTRLLIIIKTQPWEYLKNSPHSFLSLQISPHHPPSHANGSVSLPLACTFWHKTSQTQGFVAMSISVLFQEHVIICVLAKRQGLYDETWLQPWRVLLCLLSSAALWPQRLHFQNQTPWSLKNRGMHLFTNGTYTKVGEPCWWHQTIRVMLAALRGWTLSYIPTWCAQWAKSYLGYHLVSVCWGADICYLVHLRYSVILWKVKGSESLRFNLKETWVSGDPCPSYFQPQRHPASGLSWRTIRPAEQPSWAPLAWLKTI